MDGQFKRNENDATSVDIFVRELQMEPFNPILLYKRQGEVAEECPTLSKDTFLIAIQTEFQMELFRENSGKILCIDATYGTNATNAYRFKLITCLVQDKLGHGKINVAIASSLILWFYINFILLGQPVAWCISDQETTEVIQLFLSSIQKRSPQAKVSVLMTDDGK